MNNWVKSGLILTALLVLTWIITPNPIHLADKPATITERTKATSEEKRENRRIAIEYSRALGYPTRERECLLTLWTRESRFDHLAKNQRGSTAYGIAQLLGEHSSEPELQVLHGIRYIGKRYSGSACRALRFHNKHNWY